MKNQFNVILSMVFFTFLSTASFAQLRILVGNISVESGKIMVAVFNSDKTFLKESYLCGPGYPVTSEGEMTIEITELPKGTYALSIYHDVNMNDELDTNFIGIPKEPYGFSNNVKVKAGPPKFAEAKFDFQQDGQKIEIALDTFFH